MKSLQKNTLTQHLNYWLLKSEPDTFSIDHLLHARNKTTSWEGVRNYQARNNLRHMQKGDDAFFYHSSCPSPAIVGIVTIIRTYYPDPTAFDLDSPYYDPKSQSHNPRWFTVDVQLKKKFTHPLLLSTIKASMQPFDHFPLIQKGSRLSVMPISGDLWNTLLRLCVNE